MQSNKEWRHWGATDPLYAVAVWPDKELGGGAPWTAEEFLDLGARDFDDVLRHWRHYGVNFEGDCIEIGCGAGRMTKQLARAFRGVKAVDVSPAQIELARQLLGEDAGRVAFSVVDDPILPFSDGSCTAMFTCHVFQHLSSREAVKRYLSESFRTLGSGGTACFHVPIVGAHRSSRASLARQAARNVKSALKRTLGMRSVMQYRWYSPVWIFAALEGIGFVDCELRIFNMTSNGDAHSFFFARRA